MKKIGWKKAVATALSLMLVVGGLQPVQAMAATTNTEKINISLVGKYDSADTAAIRAIDLDKKEIRFRNHSTGKTYTLNYDNTSMMYDARGIVLSPALLEVGQIVDVTFLKSSKHITTLDVSKDAWVIEDTRDHELVKSDGTARIYGDIYKLDSRTLVMADGELALAEDVLSTDRITVSGIGKEIYSVMVTGGHGYVSLSSDTVEDHSLVGAWFELDNEVIYKISPNMLLSAPEGSYTMQILGNGANYQSPVTITRNQETVVDTSNVTITKPKEGLVTFEITPEEAEVFVDGEKMLTGVPQSIRYGYHNLKLIAEGYVTQDRYLKVGTPKSVVQIELEKDSASSSSSSASSESSEESSAESSEENASDEASSKKSFGTSVGDVSEITKSSSEATSAASASSASTVSENSSSQTSPNKVITGHKIYVDEPYGAELYFDGNYIGMIPTSFTKISGSHEIILKQDGYETKSYRIGIDTDEVDLNYAFPALKRIRNDDEEEAGKDNSSDNSSESGSEASEEASSAASEVTTAPEESTESEEQASSEESTESEEQAASEESTEPKTQGEDQGGTGESTEEETEKEDDAAATASGEG